MASYGVHVSVCGFQYHGPLGQIGFAPKISPENFRAAFIAAEGWGTFQQTIQDGQQTAKLLIRQGQLRLKAISLVVGTEKPPRTAQVICEGQAMKVALSIESDKAILQFAEDIVVRPDTELVVELV
jgi:hypothetical protein